MKIIHLNGNYVDAHAGCDKYLYTLSVVRNRGRLSQVRGLFFGVPERISGANDRVKGHVPTTRVYTRRIYIARVTIE